MRSTVQPFRRNSALYRVYDDLILYLKSELNWQDLSYYYQEVIEPSGLNQNILPDNHFVPLPGFDINHKTHSLISLHKTNVASVFFSGEALHENGDMMSGQSIPVSGTGVYTTGPELDSASEFDLKNDFCIEFWAQFSGVPDAPDPSYLFDFGNIKFSCLSGMLSIEAPDSAEKYFDYYDPGFIHEPDLTKPSLTNRFSHYAIQKRDDYIQLFIGPQENDGSPGPMFKILEEPLRDKRLLWPDNKYLITGNSAHPYYNIRTFGSTISGTNFFTGWMDEIKVWKTWIYDGPVVPGPYPEVSGIYLGFDDHRVGRCKAGTGPGTTKPCETFNQVDLMRQRLTRPHQYMPCSTIGGFRDQFVGKIEFFIQVKAPIDPRYSMHRPLPYIVRWYHQKESVGPPGGGISTQLPRPRKLVASTEWGIGRRRQYGQGHYTFNEGGLCNLIIDPLTYNERGIYSCKVIFGDPNRPVNVIESKGVYKTTPGAPNHYGTKEIAFTCGCISSQQLYNGPGVYTRSANLYHPATTCYPPLGNVEILWIDVVPTKPPWITTTDCFKKWAIGTDATVCAHMNNLKADNYTGPITWTWGTAGNIHAGQTDAKSCLTIPNLRKNTRFKVTAVDADGKKWEAQCGAFIDYPPLQCPTIIDLLPNDHKTNEYTVDPVGVISQVKQTNQSCEWRRDIDVKPDQTSIDIKLEIIANDPNIPDLLTGGLRYEWWQGNQWVNGLSTKNVTVSENTNVWYKCRVGYNNYPGNDPSGVRQEAWATCYFYINFPDCKGPSVEWEGISSGHQISMSTSSSNWKKANSGKDEITVNVYACSEDTEICLYGFFNRNNASFNHLQYGNPNCSRSFGGTTLQGGGYTYDDGQGVGGAGIKSRQGGPNASQNPATFKIEEYNAAHDCWGPEADKLIITKDLYSQDDGSWVELDFINECDIITKKVNFKVFQEPKPIIQAIYPSRWYWGSKRKSTRLSLYRFLHVFTYNASNLRTGVTKQYSDYWSPSSENMSFLLKPTTSGCMFWRISLNGTVLSGCNHMPGGSKCGLLNYPCLVIYNDHGITLGFSTTFGKRSATLTIDGKKAWNSIASNVFQKGVNNLKLEVCNNPSDKNSVHAGDCASHDVEIVIEDSPIIISPINNKLSGVFNKPAQTWWWRWWWPWYNPFFNPNGTPPRIYGLLKGQNGWWRWNYANTRPPGTNSMNGTRISLRTYVAMN